MEGLITPEIAPTLGVIMLALFVGFILFGFPIGFTLMAMGVGFGFLAMGDRIFVLLAQKTFQVMSSDVLISVPLFVFMGYVIERANILDRLFRSIQLAAGLLPGSLALATLATCALFATATGIVGAVVTLMGLLAYPAMLRAGYDAKLSAGVVCAGGCLGILIPPSVMLILYGAVAGESVPRLYAGAFLPGFMLAGLYMAYVVIRTMLNPSLAPQLPKEERAPFAVLSTRDVFYAVLCGLVFFSIMAVIFYYSAIPLHYMLYVGIVTALSTVLAALLGWTVTKALLTSFFPLAVLIMSVLGAIFFGWSTPSEGAALGSLGAIVLALAYRALTFQKLRDSVFLTARTSAMVCWLFVGSFIYSAVFAYLGGQGVVEDFVRGLDLSPLMFMIAAQVIIFLLGWPLEWTEIIVIFVPIFLPLLAHFQIDPLLWGTLVFVNLQAAFLSPPVAMSAFYLKGVSPSHVTLNQIFAGMMPYMLIVILCMVFLYVWPGLTLWLPKYLYGG